MIFHAWILIAAFNAHGIGPAFWAIAAFLVVNAYATAKYVNNLLAAQCAFYVGLLIRHATVPFADVTELLILSVAAPLDGALFCLFFPAWFHLRAFVHMIALVFASKVFVEFVDWRVGVPIAVAFLYTFPDGWTWASALAIVSPREHVYLIFVCATMIASHVLVDALVFFTICVRNVVTRRNSARVVRACLLSAAGVFLITQTFPKYPV